MVSARGCRGATWQEFCTPQPSAMASCTAVCTALKLPPRQAARTLAMTASGTAPETSRSVVGSTGEPCDIYTVYCRNGNWIPKREADELGNLKRGHSSAARASDSSPEGHRFKSVCPHPLFSHLQPRGTLQGCDSPPQVPTGHFAERLHSPRRHLQVLICIFKLCLKDAFLSSATYR